MVIAMDDIAMKRLLIKTTSGKSVTVTTNEDAPKPYSLALLSSIAVMMSDDRPEEIQQHQQQHHRKRKSSSAAATATATATVPSIETIDSVCEHDRPKQSGQLTRSLSRSLLSSCNLQQIMKPLVHEQQREQQQQESQQSVREKRRRMGSPVSISCPLLVPFALAAPLVTTSSKSSPMALQNEELLLVTAASNKGCMEQITGSSGTRKTTLATTTDDVPIISTPMAHCPLDEIASKNVYRSYEIQLPDCCDIGPILSNKTSNSNGSSNNRIGNGNGNGKIVDDYNYEVSTCTPLLDPPRFPSTMESFVIAKRSREEKNNWGWYA